MEAEELGQSKGIPRDCWSRPTWAPYWGSASGRAKKVSSEGRDFSILCFLFNGVTVEPKDFMLSLFSTLKRV